MENKDWKTMIEHIPLDTDKFLKAKGFSKLDIINHGKEIMEQIIGFINYERE